MHDGIRLLLEHVKRVKLRVGIGMFGVDIEALSIAVRLSVSLESRNAD